MDEDQFLKTYAPELERDKRLASVKKDVSVPNVGDTVRLNDYGLEQIYGSARGLGHMKTLLMKVVRVEETSVTYPEPTFPLEVDNQDINAFLLDNHCFDIVRRASVSHP